jgi:predicted Zn-ribbon and HTH transcriptional regulator
MKRAEFDDKVTDFLERASQCMDGDAFERGAELVYELAKFYSDRKIFTRLYCSHCGYEGHPDVEEALADKCPECEAVGCMCFYTERMWKKKCKEWGTDYVPYYR